MSARHIFSITAQSSAVSNSRRCGPEKLQIYKLYLFNFCIKGVSHLHLMSIEKKKTCFHQNEAKYGRTECKRNFD